MMRSKLVIALVLVALVLATAVAAGCGGGGGAPSPQATMSEVRVTLLVREIDEGYGSQLRVGDSVRDRETKALLGTIESVEASMARRPVETAEGEVVFSEVPDALDMRVVVRGKASVSDAGVRFGGFAVYMNDEVKLVTPLLYFRSKVVAIEPIG